MSATLASGGKTIKATCPKCRRTVYVVVIDGAKTYTDPELITVVPFGGGEAHKITARRSHGEMCLVYLSAAERTKANALTKRTQKP